MAEVWRFVRLWVGMLLALPFVIIQLGLVLLAGVLLFFIGAFGRLINWLMGNGTGQFKVGYPFRSGDEP